MRSAQYADVRRLMYLCLLRRWQTLQLLRGFQEARRILCGAGSDGKRKMVLETGRHPAELKDMVCSPAGSTIEGVRILEDKGMRSAVFEALTGAAEKGKRL